MRERKYISESGAAAIRAFKYNGGSISYSYQAIWSPLAERILKFVPLTWAPNAITVVGTLIHITGCLALALQGLGNHVIPWTLLFFSLCVIVYYNLDNVDGKQARRTGSSSPLGMCMDHGCDALGVSFITLGVASLSLIGDERVILFTVQSFVLGSFWMSVWAQYHSQGVLILGKINAVDDGIPFVSFLGFITFVLGQDFWLTEFCGVTLQKALVAFIWIAGVSQIVPFVRGEKFTKDVKGALMHLIHFPLMSASLFCISHFTNWPEQYFYPIYFCTALTVVKDITYMHLCVTAKQTYNQFTTTTLVYIFSFPCFILSKVLLNVTLVPDWLFVYGMTGYFVYSYVEYVSRAAREMAQILGVEIFRLKGKSG